MAWSPNNQMERNLEFFSPEGIAAREAQKQAGKERLEGTYAQRAADEQRMKGTFDQNAKLKREIEGTFNQNSGMRRQIEGTFAERHAGAKELAGIQGEQALEQIDYRERPGGIQDRELRLKGELGRGELSQGEKRLGLMGDELAVKKHAMIGEHLGKAREDAVRLFPDEPERAAEYYRQEKSRITKMFPDLAPPISGLGKWDGAPGGKGPGSVAQDVAADRSLIQSIKPGGPTIPARSETMAAPPPPPAASPERYGDLFPTPNPKPSPRMVPAAPPPDADLFPGGGGMTAGAQTVNTPARRRPIPTPGKVIQPVPNAISGTIGPATRKIYPFPSRSRDIELFRPIHY